MKKILIGSLLIVIAGIACNNELPEKIYSPGSLPSTYFTIDTRKDTLLQTPTGTSIFVPAGAIQAAKEKAFRLEVKEALYTADVVLNGLITQSNDQPLSSGGMIFIQPADDPSAAILKPLTVKLHTNKVLPGMLLYKGVVGKDSIINWTEPAPVQVIPPNEDLAAGKQFFEVNCKSCHDVNKKFTGPPLLHVTAKHSREWLEGFIRNNAEVLASEDCYARTIYQEYNKAAMPLYPNTTSKEMDQLLTWLESESKRIDPAGYELTLKKRDSCELYLIVSNPLLMQAKSPIVDIVLKNRALDQHYDFMVNAFGWWNADRLMEDNPASQKSYLSVRVTGPVSNTTQVFLVIPNEGVFLRGGLLKGTKDEYGFFRRDGNGYLPPDKDAWVMVVDDQPGRLLFDSAGFKTGIRQTLQLKPQLSSPGAYEKAIRELAGDPAAIEREMLEEAVKDRWEMDAPASARWPKPTSYKCGCDSPRLSVF
ncbi:c-type cytochrome [Chitinophaga arvensicola]|uniref:Cytochrome c n=1 Tax=Chitinophaga arvensicola TaxID=29529 RepID=A0A1I0S6F1_9BACT|nr:cytochrome c [Chitinophaga arvensicola]SEW50983.1 Cytochrome c [Chitinophaga arvensicola]